MTEAPITLWWPHPRRVWLLPELLRTDTGGSVERLLLRPLTALGAVGMIVTQVGRGALNCVPIPFFTLGLAAGATVLDRRLGRATSVA